MHHYVSDRQTDRKRDRQTDRNTEFYFLFQSFSVISKSMDFPSDFHGWNKMLVEATLEIYHSAIANLLPTPAKSHYTFNLRDFSRVVLGCCLVRWDGRFRIKKHRFTRLLCSLVVSVSRRRLGRWFIAIVKWETMNRQIRGEVLIFHTSPKHNVTL